MTAVTYRDYRLTLRLLAPLGTPMQSDTLFGYLACHIAWTEGPGAVEAFLEPFLSGAPPFILSDAFPAGLLPRPLFPSVPEPYRAARTDRHEWRLEGHVRKAAWMTVEDFLAVMRGEQRPTRPVASPWLSVETPHAAIDRSTDTTAPGGRLYTTQAAVLARSADTVSGQVEVYIRARDGWAERIAELLRAIAPAGFGRDRSVGTGAFEVVALEPFDSFGGFAGADAFVSLSTWMPASDDPTDGRWRIRIKRGFLAPGIGQGHPFKRPMIQIEPGAVFRVPAGDVRPWYGRIVRDIAPGAPEAVQCGYTLSVPARWVSR